MFASTQTPQSGALRIVAHSGFAEFLEHFAAVADDASACWRAAGRRARVVIEDVDEDEAFAPHRPIGSSASSRRTSAVRTAPPPGSSS
jgi:hypothetical protein